MDLEDAAALSACARVERQRLEAQHERNSLVAAARWCLAMRRSQSRSGAAAASMCTRKERGRERVVCTLDRRARVEHYSASRGGIPCHSGRGEGSASGGSLSCVSRAAAAASGRLGSGRQDCLALFVGGVSLSFTRYHYASLLLAPLSVNYTFFTRVF